MWMLRRSVLVNRPLNYFSHVLMKDVSVHRETFLVLSLSLSNILHFISVGHKIKIYPDNATVFGTKIHIRASPADPHILASETPNQVSRRRFYTEQEARCQSSNVGPTAQNRSTTKQT